MNARGNYHRTRRAKAVVERRCVQCLAGLQPDDGCRCVECAEAHRISAKKSYAKLDPQKRRERTARLAEERNAAGLCAHCGKEPRDGDRKWGRGCLQKNKEYDAIGKSYVRGTDITPIRMPTIPYQPLDEREQNMRVRMLRTLWRLTNDGEWADAAEILLAANVEMNDERGGSRERNRAEVMLGRLAKAGVVDRRGERKSYHYRVNEISRAEVKAWRVGELPNVRGARAA